MQSGWLEAEFVSIFNPMPIRGATGSAGSPIAVT